MDVAEIVRALLLQERWQEIRERRAEFVAASDTAGLARVHADISTAFFYTAQSPDDWIQAIYHARMAHRYAPPGTPMYTYTLHKLAGLLLSTGHLDQAKRLAQAVILQAPSHPVLERFVPYTLYDLSLIAYYQRRFPTAIAHARRAAAGFLATGNQEQTIRTRIHLAWCYLRAGRIGTARRLAAIQLPDHLQHLGEGIHAAILAREGRLEEALIVGRRALARGRKNRDQIDAAEIALLLADVAVALRMHGEAQAFMREAVKYAALQSWDAYSLLILTRRAGGGDSSDSSYNYCHGNLRLHDACYTTGVA